MSSLIVSIITANTTTIGHYRSFSRMCTRYLPLAPGRILYTAFEGRTPEIIKCTQQIVQPSASDRVRGVHRAATIIVSE